MKILMVCLGNICRSPLAEGILKHKVKNAGLDWIVDSAGIGDWHAGDLPDKRSIATAQRYNVDITDQRARQIRKEDLKKFDSEGYAYVASLSTADKLVFRRAG